MIDSFFTLLASLKDQLEVIKFFLLLQILSELALPDLLIFMLLQLKTGFDRSVHYYFQVLIFLSLTLLISF